MARKLFSKTDYENLATSDSTPASPELISSQETVCNCQEAIKIKDTTPVDKTVSSPTCSQDVFNNIDPSQFDITPSHVISSTPIFSPERHKCDRLVTVVMEQTDVTEADALVCTKNSDTSNHKPDSGVQAHTTDVDPSGTGSSPDYKSDITDQKNKISNPDTSYHATYHDNSDLMNELFANNMVNLTQSVTEQLLKEKEEKWTHSNNNTDGDDVIHNDVMHHVINKDEKLSTITPINTANGFYHSSLHHNIRVSLSTSNGSTKKSTKPFKAPRLAKEVSKEEQNKLLEQYSKKFPSLVMNDKTPVSDCNVENSVVTSSSRLIACGFTSVGSGKKFTVSAVSLQRAARFVEDFSTDMISEEYGVTNSDCSVSEEPPHVEGPIVKGVCEVKMPSSSTTTAREETKENSLSCLVEKEGLEFGKEEESRETIKRSHEIVENYSLENIDMEQFSAFTQMPVYIRDITEDNSTVNEISDTTCTPDHHTTPVHKEPISSYITPGGSFNPCPPATARGAYNNATPCRQLTDGQDDEEYNTQVMKQFLDFSSSNEDDDTVSVKVTDQIHSEKSNAGSPTHCNKSLPCARSCDTDSHAHNELPTHNNIPENNRSCDTDDHTYSRSYDDTNSPTRTDLTVSIPNGVVFGLSTASGKSVTISTDAISSVKKLLDDKCPERRNKVTTKTFSGFCTASGDVVNVSTQSLEAVKQLFNDDKMPQDSDDIVASGNQTHHDNSITTKDEGTGVAVTSFIDSSYDPAIVTMTTDVSSLHKSCDPTHNTTVTMETTPTNITNVSVQQ